MTITKNGDSLIIKFAFDYYLLRLVKSLNGRKYDPKRKCWSIPLIGSKQAVEKLAGEGFAVDPAVWEAIDADEQAERELESVAGQADAEFATSLPLLNYQRVGAAFLTKAGGGLLADEVGLGKTIQSLAAIERLEAKSVLIFCPAVLKYQWQAEIKKFTGEEAVVIDGDRAERVAGWQKKARYVIANYELLLRDLIFMPKEWDLIIADEATRIANPWTKTYRALEKLGAKHKIALTGTPISNRPQELYGIVNWIKPGVLGSYISFIDRYCVKNIYGGIFSYRNLDELQQRIKRFMVRRKKEDVLKELPDKVFIDVPFALSDEEKKVYNNIRMELIHELKNGEMAKIENPVSIQNTLVKMLRLKQVADSLELLGNSQKSTKLEVLGHILQENVENGSKVIVFTQFSTMADILERELASYKPLKITGEVKGRHEIVKEFNEAPDRKLLIMTEAGAYGLNIQAANVIVHYDCPWSLAKLEQREGRAHRMGQKKTVFCYRLMAKGTVDMYIKKVLTNKERLAGDLLGDPITMKDIRQMLDWE